MTVVRRGHAAAVPVTMNGGGREGADDRGGGRTAMRGRRGSGRGSGGWEGGGGGEGWRSERQPDLERFDDGGAGVVDADDAEQAAEEYDEAVEHDGAPLERVAL